jgi:hypothetical protein
VQERALKVVPDLCETIDYAEVQGVLFPRVAVSRNFNFHYISPPTGFLRAACIHEDPNLNRQSGDSRHLPCDGENP